MNTPRTFSFSLAAGALAAALCGCAADVGVEQEDPIGSVSEELSVLDLLKPATELTPFAFSSQVSTSGEFGDGDVRLDAVVIGGKKLKQWGLATVKYAKILIDDGVDVARGGHNFASGQGINSELDDWEKEGPATITPVSRDLKESLDNFNLSSIVVTREAEGTASLEIAFLLPVNTLLFWERGSLASATTANSDLLVEALDWRGRVTAAYKLLRSEYSPTGIEITTWNGSFASPSTPTGAKPQLGSVGLALNAPAQRFRLTSVQEPVGGLRDDGPDYKVIGALLPHWPQH